MFLIAAVGTLFIQFIMSKPRLLKCQFQRPSRLIQVVKGRAFHHQRDALQLLVGIELGQETAPIGLVVHNWFQLLSGDTASSTVQALPLNRADTGLSDSNFMLARIRSPVFNWKNELIFVHSTSVPSSVFTLARPLRSSVSRVTT